ncbi:NSFL1 cofactor p47-like isoform X1 [Amphibalanus amphitrite]|uniref:NSFL1 cofactor p47-like isoform X1 n=1 Tax=Amphibalanus amphitrite TaxID=1232801 RepID=UPI001C90C800|nr:NSFL1 cofactor p47-like isoform X1 [Amphibalanus amphitrite]
MADKEGLVAQFMAITGVDTDRATFYLESAGWNLDAAMGSFYDHDGGAGEQEQREAGEVTGAAAAGAAGGGASSDAAPSEQPTRRSQRQAGATIRTFQGLMGSDSDSDEEGQAFFAGGSETSGQQILGPKRGKKKGEDIVKEMFQAAKGHGAEEVDPSEEAPQPRRRVFGGTGYRLGQTGSDSEVVPGAPDNRPPQPRTVKLRLWRTGFSVDDGELREYSDPANQEFLNSVREGQVPLELIRDAQGGEVHLDMEDHRHEDYVKPKAKPKPFSGVGHVLGSPSAAGAGGGAAADGGHWSLSAALSAALGLLFSLMDVLWRFFSPAPAVVGAGAASSAPAAAASAGDPAASEAAARAALALDESQPTTSVQVRLTDGSRLVVKLNLTHTIGDLRQYIATARPHLATRPFALLTTFPSKELTDDSVTVKDGALLNAAILQRAQ